MFNSLDDKKHLYIRDGLPASHQWVETEIADQKIPGAVWEKKDINAINGIHLYKAWPTVMFANPWYGIESQAITNKQATKRDITILQKILGKHFAPPATLIDVHCGCGRHAIALAELGFHVIGLEEVALPLQLARKNAKKHHIKATFLRSTAENYKKQKASADIVISMFNSLGYTFDKEDDLRQLIWIIGLLKPGGYFVLDIRSESYQKKNFSLAPVKCKSTLPLHHDPSLTITMTTQKYWQNSILGAKEKIVIEKNGQKILAQYMTYGWRTYSLVELQEMLDIAGAELVDFEEDYYSSPENFGERIFLLARAKE